MHASIKQSKIKYSLFNVFQFLFIQLQYVASG